MITDDKEAMVYSSVECIMELIQREHGSLLYPRQPPGIAPNALHA